MDDYASRGYLSVGEVAAYLGVSVREVHRLARSDALKSYKSTSGQYRFALAEVRKVAPKSNGDGGGNGRARAAKASAVNALRVRGTEQKLHLADARSLAALDDESVHLCITSPPYFNAKMYSDLPGDLGNIHDLDEWFAQIGKAWAEVFRVLQSGRKFFLNIMNLPVRNKNSYRTLNLVGKSIDLCEELGFVFKRDIIWHKTNGVRAHFGTYPYPGGILINNMHEFILEFHKAERPGVKTCKPTRVCRRGMKSSTFCSRSIYTRTSSKNCVAYTAVGGRYLSRIHCLIFLTTLRSARATGRTLATARGRPCKSNTKSPRAVRLHHRHCGMMLPISRGLFGSMWPRSSVSTLKLESNRCCSPIFVPQEAHR